MVVAPLHSDVLPVRCEVGAGGIRPPCGSADETSKRRRHRLAGAPVDPHPRARPTFTIPRVPRVDLQRLQPKFQHMGAPRVFTRAGDHTVDRSDCRAFVPVRRPPYIERGPSRTFQPPVFRNTHGIPRRLGGDVVDNVYPTSVSFPQTQQPVKPRARVRG